MMTIYLSQNEIQELLSLEGPQQGIAYEWEGENVVHLRLHPLRHAFGNTAACLFTHEQTDRQGWQVVADGQTVKVYYNGMEMQANFIPSEEELYSRSKGILEVSILKAKHVAIIGLGSFGSQIAIELAKAGVGEFSLFDFDRVELHNLARHTCVLQDLGRLKTDAIEDAILGKNPYATVHKHPVNITIDTRELEEAVKVCDLVICATDNNASRFTLAELVHKYQKTCIYGRAITRAEGGDVFISRPGEACYCCLVGNDWFEMQNEEITDEQSARRTGAIAAYVSAEDADAMVQVGLSSDIAPICNMMVKLALVELSRGQNSSIQSLEQEFTYNYYMWANRRERKYANWHALPGAGAMPTIVRWYGSHIKKQPDCAVCSHVVTLDTGEQIEQRLNNQGDTSDINIDNLLNQLG